MIYQILHPYNVIINSDSFRSAVKQYIKNQDKMIINNFIITDKIRYMNAKIKYFNNGKNRNKVGINMVPIDINGLPINPNNYIPYNTIQSQLLPLRPLGPLGPLVLNYPL